MKKNLAELGTVLHKIKDHSVLKPWADYLASIEPWKKLNVNADQLMQIWSSTQESWQVYSAIAPRDAKRKDITLNFDYEHGLIVFATKGAPSIVRNLLKESGSLNIEDGGFVQVVTAKAGHKGVGKYLLSAAERVISDSCSQVFAILNTADSAGQRLFKSCGYEAANTFGTEILYVKRLTS